MTAQNGALVLIQVGNGGAPEVFTTIGGLRTSEMQVNHEMLESSNRESGPWRQLLSGAGMLSMRIGGSGVFTDSAAEELLRGYAFSGGTHNYRFVFANGDNVTGPFCVVAYERLGDHDAEEMFALTLESAGAVVFTG